MSTSPTQSSLRIVSGDAAPADERLLGGKGARLAELTGAGLPVPAWLCVTTHVFDDVRARLREPLAALAALDPEDRGAVRDACRRVADAVRAAGLPPADAAALVAAFAAAFPAGTRVAVRSSVVGEDSADASFAGQMDSYLHVTAETLLARVLDCMASAFTDRAIVYRRRRGLPVDDIRAAVVVQRMVDARAAGVLFTANPQTSDTGEMVVSAGLGLGEGVVSGSVDTDTYYLDGASGAERRAEIVRKAEHVVFDAARGTGTRLAPVPDGDAGARALAPAELSRLAELGRRLVALAGGAPQDVEWAIDAGGLHLLQTRAITTLRPPIGAPGGRESIFDNANIVESYPGLVQPLTFSIARAGYERIFLQNSRLMGTPESVLRRNADIYPNLVALIEGRVYYNILSWYRIFQQIPGFEWALPAWEKALGLDHMERPRERTLAEKLAAVPAQARVWSHIVWHVVRLEAEVASYLERVRDVQDELAARDLGAVCAHGLLELADGVLDRLMPDYAVAPFNDSITQQLHELLAKLITRFGLGDPHTLRNQLLCGEDGMESVAPVRSTMALVEKIRGDGRLAALFRGDAPPADVWRAVHERADLAGFRDALHTHLDLYGDRMVQELKLETPSWEDDPGFVVTMLRNFLASSRSNASMQDHERAVRAEAERAARRALGPHPLRRALFAWVLRRTRAGVRDRENLRFARTRVMGMLRRLYRELGRRLADARVLADARDVFWLTTAEVAGYVRGQAPSRDAGALVAQRKREYAAFAARPAPPSRIVTRGVVYGDLAAPTAAPAAGDTLLRGVGCSPGRVEAASKVVLDPAREGEVRGQILVAPSTDPGWVFLMVAASGLIAERGSILSHTAIIGRELGIPTVVGVRDATRRIRSGDRLVLDGTAGTVQIVASDYSDRS